mmetsp:Transcript_118215/g.376833  ORF Transcript_118215/g.376833 Transcript_118215/m.376833 type:complete len:202 (-) Transcript_118215:193-798(-)
MRKSSWASLSRYPSTEEVARRRAAPVWSTAALPAHSYAMHPSRASCAPPRPRCLRGRDAPNLCPWRLVSRTLQRHKHPRQGFPPAAALRHPLRRGPSRPARRRQARYEYKLALHGPRRLLEEDHYLRLVSLEHFGCGLSEKRCRQARNEMTLLGLRRLLEAINDHLRLASLARFGCELSEKQVANRCQNRLLPLQRSFRCF